jgi:hypothetical protein
MIDNTLHDRKGTNKTMIDKTTEWVREWLLFNVNLSAISWWEQVGWDDVEMDWTQIITIYKGPLHIINNYNSTYGSNSKIQYTTL